MCKLQQNIYTEQFQDHNMILEINHVISKLSDRVIEKNYRLKSLTCKLWSIHVNPDNSPNTQISILFRKRARQLKIKTAFLPYRRSYLILFVFLISRNGLHCSCRLSEMQDCGNIKPKNPLRKLSCNYSKTVLDYLAFFFLMK